MLNRDLFKREVSALKNAVEKQQKVAAESVQACTQLHALRKDRAHRLVCEVEAYINTMKKTPAEFKKAFEAYRVQYSLFEHVVQGFAQQGSSTDIKTSAGVGAGVAAGAATAFMGPTAAMAVATTFGTASTGTAISALSGAAATNAALAWLGGGALAAGGGGMSAGSALLGLAGPVGWTLAGVAVAGGALYMRSANAKAAGEAQQQRFKVEAEIRSLQVCTREVQRIAGLTSQTCDGLAALLHTVRDELGVTRFEGQPDAVKNQLIAMINHVQALGQLLEQKVEMKAG